MKLHKLIRAPGTLKIQKGFLEAVKRLYMKMGKAG